MPAKGPKKTTRSKSLPQQKRQERRAGRLVSKSASSKIVWPKRIGHSWDDNLFLLAYFRGKRPGQWPSRESADPTEAWLADWLRHNLELHAASRLEPYQKRRIEELISGQSGKPKKIPKSK